MKGQVVGQYELREELGSGTFGTVWKAKHQNADSWRAIKLAHDPALVEQFRTEFEVLDRLDHRNIVRVHDLLTSGDVPAIVFEYVEGTDLERLLKQQGKLPWQQAIAIAMDVLDGLAVAHEAGLLHRDIKPSNVLIPTTGPAKIADFGLVSAAERSGSVVLSRAGGSGGVVGTHHYMAPEVEEQGEAVPQSDLFSLGVMLYECLTGRLPRGIVRPPSALDCPPELDEPVLALLAPEAGERPATALAARGMLLQTVRPLETVKTEQEADGSVGSRAGEVASTAEAFVQTPDSGGRPATVADLLREADWCADREAGWSGGGYAKAVSLYGQVLTFEPGHLHAHAGRAMAYGASGDEEKAAADWRRALELPALTANDHCWRGVALWLFLDQRSPAGDELTAAIAADPDNWDAYLWRARLRLACGDAGGAIADLNRATTINPARPEPYFERGRFHAHAEQWEEARKDLAAAVRLALEVDTYVCYHLLAIKANQTPYDLPNTVLGDLITECRRILRIRPDCPDAIWDLCDALRAKAKRRTDAGDYAGAVEDLTELLEHSHDSSDYSERGQLHVRLGEYEKAIQDFSNAIENGGTGRCNEELLMRRAEANEKAGHYSAAADDHARQLDLFGRGSTVKLAQMLIEAERYDDAIDAYRQAMASRPTDGFYDGDLGHLYLRMGRYQDAIACFTTHLRFAPNCQASWFARGKAYAATRAVREAISDFSRAINLASYHSEVYLARAELRLATNALRDAAKDATAAIGLDATCAQAYNLRGEAHRRLGKHERARADLQKAIELDPEGPIGQEARKRLGLALDP